MTKNKPLKLNILIHSIIFISTLILVTLGVCFGAGEGQLGNHVVGLEYFKPFTIDSNILAGISSFFVVIYSIQVLLKKRDKLPRWVVIFEYMGTTCLLLTILTVVFFLAPSSFMNGDSYFIFFTKDMFFFHLINPLLSVFSFIVLQRDYRFSLKECLWGVLPMMLYSCVYLICVVTRRWEDFYGFTFGGNYSLIPLVLIVMLLVVTSLSILLIRMNQKLT